VELEIPNFIRSPFGGMVPSSLLQALALVFGRFCKSRFLSRSWVCGSVARCKGQSISNNQRYEIFRSSTVEIHFMVDSFDCGHGAYVGAGNFARLDRAVLDGEKRESPRTPVRPR
jgi:hypothetical protein